MSAEDTKMGRKNSRESRTTEKDDEKVWKSFPPCARIRRFEKILAHPPPRSERDENAKNGGSWLEFFSKRRVQPLETPFIHTHTNVYVLSTSHCEPLHSFCLPSWNRGLREFSCSINSPFEFLEYSWRRWATRRGLPKIVRILGRAAICRSENFTFFGMVSIGLKMSWEKKRRTGKRSVMKTYVYRGLHNISPEHVIRRIFSPLFSTINRNDRLDASRFVEQSAFLLRRGGWACVNWINLSGIRVVSSIKTGKLAGMDLGQSGKKKWKPW